MPCLSLIQDRDRKGHVWLEDKDRKGRVNICSVILGYEDRTVKLEDKDRKGRVNICIVL